MSVTPPTSRPAVVFLDLGMMLSFDQLASRLHARGVEVAHVTMADNPLARLASDVLYDQTHFWRTPADFTTILTTIGARRIVDVQCPEALLDDVLVAARRAGLPAGTIARLEHRLAWRDKSTATRALAAAGVPVPRSATLDEVASLGLPAVLKVTVGSGGEGVRVVDTAEQRDATVAGLVRDGVEAYAEEFLPGETLCWAGTVRDGRVVDACVYRTRQMHRAEGPSSVIEVVEDADVRRAGDLAAAEVGGSGLLNLDLVRAADGSPRVVDVNLRAWHSVVALAALGHDFTGAYLASLGLAPEPAPGTATGVVHVFPDQDNSQLAVSRRAGFRRFVADAWAQRRVLPPRYLAVQMVLFGRRLLDDRPSGEAGEPIAA